MKKFFSVMLLAVALIFISGQTNQAEAREVYMGNYSDGTAVYLLTETIKFTHGERRDMYDCDVRAGYDYLHYVFWLDGDYSNSEGYRGNIRDGSSPVAAAIYRYITNR